MSPPCKTVQRCPAVWHTIQEGGQRESVTCTKGKRQHRHLRVSTRKVSSEYYLNGAGGPHVSAELLRTTHPIISGKIPRNRPAAAVAAATASHFPRGADAWISPGPGRRHRPVTKKGQGTCRQCWCPISKYQQLTSRLPLITRHTSACQCGGTLAEDHSVRCVTASL